MRLDDEINMFVDERWMQDNRFDVGPYVVIHLAAKTGVGKSWLQSQEYFDSNVATTQRMLEFCRLSSSSLIYLSSASYGPSDGNKPHKEIQALCADNPYALSKIMAEELCQFYAQYFQVPITILRPFNVYGPGQSSRFLIPHLISEVITKNQVEVENLTTSRDYIFVDDVIDVIVRCMGYVQGFRVLNVGTGVGHSVSEVLEILWELVGERKPILNKNIERRNQVNTSVADIARIQGQLSWQPQIDLSEGLKIVWSNVVA